MIQNNSFVNISTSLLLLRVASPCLSNNVNNCKLVHWCFIMGTHCFILGRCCNTQLLHHCAFTYHILSSMKMQETSKVVNEFRFEEKFTMVVHYTPRQKIFFTLQNQCFTVAVGWSRNTLWWTSYSSCSPELPFTRSSNL